MSEYEADWEKCCREFKEKLIVENKSLKDGIGSLTKRLLQVNQSHDELLEAVTDLTNFSRPQHPYNHYFKIIKKAVDLR